MKEKDIEKAVCDYAKSKGLLVYKFTSPAHRSVPDRLFVLPDGRMFFIEFKAPGGKLTTGQQRELERLWQRRVQAYVVHDSATGIGIINDAGLCAGGYWCVVCGRHLPADEDGVIVHDDVPHPADMTFDEEERPQ